jgi:hypothetical protein
MEGEVALVDVVVLDYDMRNLHDTRKRTIRTPGTTVPHLAKIEQHTFEYSTAKVQQFA